MTGGSELDVFAVLAGDGEIEIVDFVAGEDRLDFRSFDFASGDAVRLLATSTQTGILIDLPDAGTLKIRTIATTSDLIDEYMLL